MNTSCETRACVQDDDGELSGFGPTRQSRLRLQEEGGEESTAVETTLEAKDGKEVKEDRFSPAPNPHQPTHIISRNVLIK